MCVFLCLHNTSQLCGAVDPYWGPGALPHIGWGWPMALLYGLLWPSSPLWNNNMVGHLSWAFSSTLNTKKSISKIRYLLMYQQHVIVKSVSHLKSVRLWFIMQHHPETWLLSCLGSALSNLHGLKTLILIKLFMAHIDWFKAFVHPVGR